MLQTCKWIHKTHKDGNMTEKDHKMDGNHNSASMLHRTGKILPKTDRDGKILKICLLPTFARSSLTTYRTENERKLEHAVRRLLQDHLPPTQSCWMRKLWHPCFQVLAFTKLKRSPESQHFWQRLPTDCSSRSSQKFTYESLEIASQSFSSAMENLSITHIEQLSYKYCKLLWSCCKIW